MSDYLAELAAAYPEVRALPAYTNATKAAASLEKKATIQAAIDLSSAFEQLAVHFDSQPDATLSPKSLANTSSALELKHEAETVFKALPDQFTALAGGLRAASRRHLHPDRSHRRGRPEGQGRGGRVRVRRPDASTRST